MTTRMALPQSRVMRHEPKCFRLFHPQPVGSHFAVYPADAGWNLWLYADEGAAISRH